MTNGRCRMHGGPSTGPRTPQGLANSQQARLRHGRYSAARKQLRRQLAWVGKFCKVLGEFIKMHRSLYDFTTAFETGQPPDLLAPQCLRALSLYERCLKMVDTAVAAGLDPGKGPFQREEQKLAVVLWAGTEGARAQDLAELLAGPSSDVRLVISILLSECEQKIAELFRVALSTTSKALDAVEHARIDGLDLVDRPDHQIRLLAVGRFTRLMNVLAKQDLRFN